MNVPVLHGDEPRAAGVPLVEVPPAGDTAPLVAALARVIADVCAVEVPRALRPRPIERAEAA